MTVLLRAEGLAKSFRGLKAVAGASFDVAEGQISALIGPNGAGKTTVFNLIAGVYTPDAGTIHFRGQPIHGLRPDQVCAAGIGRTFQLVKPFPGLSVLDNVVVGALLVEKTVAAARAASLAILAKLGLDARAAQPAAMLTLSDRKRLEVARALATRPRLLLLDEVMAGLRPTECDQLVDVFRALHRSEGVAILLIEHVMRAVMALAQHIAVLDRGAIIARGAPDEVVKNPAVLQCYLGEDTEI
jgi:branched-chain amino acid transport system ATP-binding protein